jgi:hypothetical protein
VTGRTFLLVGQPFWKTTLSRAAYNYPPPSGITLPITQVPSGDRRTPSVRSPLHLRQANLSTQLQNLPVEERGADASTTFVGMERISVDLGCYAMRSERTHPLRILRTLAVVIEVQPYLDFGGFGGSFTGTGWPGCFMYCGGGLPGSSDGCFGGSFTGTGWPGCFMYCGGPPSLGLPGFSMAPSSLVCSGNPGFFSFAENLNSLSTAM